MGMILFVSYSLLVIGASFYAGRKQKGEEGFFVNGRSSSAAMVAFSIVASCVGASATIGTVGLAFSVGTPAFWWLGSGAIGLSVMSIFLAGRVRRSRARTMPEIVEGFFGYRCRQLISLVVVLAWLSILAAQFTAMGKIVSALSGLEYRQALLYGCLLISAHSLLGGQAGIMKLDRLQSLLIVGGLLVCALWLSRCNPSAFSTIRPEIVNERFPLSRLVYFLTILGGSYVVCPMLFGRLLSARDENEAVKGCMGAVPALVFISALIVLIGLMTRGLISPATPDDEVFSTMVGTVFPFGLALVIYVMMLSAIVSSADSCLVTAGLVLAYDLCKRTDVLCSRLCMLLLSGLALLLTFSDKGILGFLLMANDIYVCGVVGPVFVGLLLAKRTPCHEAIAFIAIALGGGLGLLSAFIGNIHFSYAGICSSVALSLLSLWLASNKQIKQFAPTE